MQEIIRNVSQYLHGKRKGDEIVPALCPFCNGGERGDKETFAFNTITGAYNCKRGTCGVTGNAITLAKHFGIYVNKIDYFREVRKPKKVYKKPDIKSHGLTKEIIAYFKKRGISEETLIKNKVTSKDNNIVFNYYENGELVFVKYKIPRQPRVVNGKKETKSWREADTKPILYGMDDCDTTLPLIIIEGEPDKLVLDECGIKNGVSIPSGTNEFGWIEECWEFLEQFQEIIIWGDNDKAGKEFVQEVLSRLEDWKLKIVKCERKDANEILYYDGKEKVIEHIKNAQVVRKDYIVDLADVKRKDYTSQIAVSTGYQELDTLIGGFYGGQLVVWTGYNGSGKSTILSNVIINGIDNHKTFAYSGELPKEDFKEWMDLQLSGTKHLTSYMCPVKKQSIAVPKEENYKWLDDMYNGMMYLFDSEDYATDEEVMKAMEYMAKREGTKIFIIDNLLTVPLKSNGEINEKQAKFIIKLKKFARRFNAIVHLVAHPRKPSFGQTRVDKYSIAGTANISDLSDRVIGFHMLNEKDREANQKYNEYSNVLIIFKDRKFGVYDQEVLFKFDYHSKRYYTNEQERNKEYSWVKKKQSQSKEVQETWKAPWD